MDIEFKNVEEFSVEKSFEDENTNKFLKKWSRKNEQVLWHNLGSMERGICTATYHTPF